MITRFHVQNYKALRDVKLDLTPVHVLIGPNDSGKTSILDAIAALCRSVDHPLGNAFTGSWNGRDLVWRGELDLAVSLKAAGVVEGRSYDYELSCGFLESDRGVKVREETVWTNSAPVDLTQEGTSVSRVYRAVCQGKPTEDDLRVKVRAVHEMLLGVHSYRWDPRLLALPVALDSKRTFRMEASGFGLAMCLDDIIGYERSRFDELEDRFRNVFPHIRSIKLKQELGYKAPVDDPTGVLLLSRAEGKGIHFQFVGDGPLVPASQVSDGVMLVLAYLAILYLPDPPCVLLVEEPENGIHPKRLQDVLKILRELVEKQSHTQVILTTHSPYVVDLFEPEEVTLCRMEDDGAISVRRLSESKSVREQLDVFTLGEIWSAEGDDALAESAKPEGKDSP